MSKQHQALFTELTAQQAPAIHGGLAFRLDSLEVIQAGEDHGVKILKSRLSKAGFILLTKRGKGSHSDWRHHLYPLSVIQ
jgi:hypothetical protein